MTGLQQGSVLLGYPSPTIHISHAIPHHTEHRPRTQHNHPTSYLNPAHNQEYFFKKTQQQFGISFNKVWGVAG
jgi:hypothetical protein